jgi:hypothetical protein
VRSVKIQRAVFVTGSPIYYGAQCQRLGEYTSVCMSNMAINRAQDFDLLSGWLELVIQHGISLNSVSNLGTLTDIITIYTPGTLQLPREELKHSQVFSKMEIISGTGISTH